MPPSQQRPTHALERHVEHIPAELVRSQKMASRSFQWPPRRELGLRQRGRIGFFLHALEQAIDGATRLLCGHHVVGLKSGATDPKNAIHHAYQYVDRHNTDRERATQPQSPARLSPQAIAANTDPEPEAAQHGH